MAIDVFKHASSGNMSEAHIFTNDLDFFPLFEALRDTPVAVHLHCHTPYTADELMNLADVVIPVNYFTALSWLRHPSRDHFVEWNVNFAERTPSHVFREGTFEGLPFIIYKDHDQPFVARAMAYNPGSAYRSPQWEWIVDDFEARVGKRVYFD